MTKKTDSICCVLVVVFFLALFGGFIYWAVSTTPKAGDKGECRYSAGDIVETVVSSAEGQILRAWKYDGACSYRVRVSIPSEHVPGGFLFSGGEVSKEPFSVVMLQEFEIK